MSDRPPPSSAVLVDTPKAGTIEQIEACGGFARGVAAEARDFGALVRKAGEILSGAKSAAVELLAAKLGDRLVPGALTLERSSVSAEQAFGSYAAEVDRIHCDADRIVADVESALETVRVCASTIERIAQAIGAPPHDRWDVAPAITMPEPNPGSGVAGASAAEWELTANSLRAIHGQEWLYSATTWRATLDQVDSLRARWAALVEERAIVERRMVRGLEETGIGQLIALAGGQGPGFASSHERLIALAISGELRGSAAGAAGSATAHPLLRSLLGTESGEGIWSDPPPPANTAAWWDGLTAAQRQRLILEVPWVIGNLPGLPFAVRDEANRNLLKHCIAHADDLSPAGREALREIVAVLEEGPDEPAISLVSLDLGGLVPLAAIGYGDLDRARNLAWEVPGMYNDLHQGLPGWNRASRNLYEEQAGLLDAAGRSAEGTGLIAFLSYDTPNLGTVLSARTARDAAPRLAAELDGGYAAGQAGDPPPSQSVVAHSYGTPVAANALLLVEHPVQSFTMVASAGLEGERIVSLADLEVERNAAGMPKIYTTIATADDLAPFGSNVSGRLQPNPQAAWSAAGSIGGAYAFSTEGAGALKATLGHSVVRADGHGYFDRQTQSLRNIAALTLGETGRVSGVLEVAEKRAPNAFETSGRALQLGGRYRTSFEG